MSGVSEQIMQEARLVSLPDVYLRLKAVVDDPDSNLADVADVVSNDPALTARLLRLVNSAYFGLATEIDTVSRAISLLGTQEVHDLALAVSVADTVGGLHDGVMDMHRFWHRSVASAIASRELASMCNVLDSERLFVCGLLHDIGHLFMYQVAAPQVHQARELASRERIPLYKAERAVLGIDYARVGADLMRNWQLPQSLWEPTEFHVQPQRSVEFGLFTSLVHIASLLTAAADEGIPVEEALDRIDSSAWQATGLTAHQSAGTIAKVEPQVGAVISLIFPNMRAA